MRDRNERDMGASREPGRGGFASKLPSERQPWNAVVRSALLDWVCRERLNGTEPVTE